MVALVVSGSTVRCADALIPRNIGEMELESRVEWHPPPKAGWAQRQTLREDGSGGFSGEGNPGRPRRI